MDKKATILIVEDEKIPAEFFKEILEINGYEVLGICDKGADAIKSALSLKPDVIFMDIMLKDNISGSEAALKISTSIDTKIIFLTAHSDEEMIEYALDAGAVNYLIKPYKEKQIITTLEMALKQKKDVTSKQERGIKLAGGFYYDFINKNLQLNHKEVEIGLKSLELVEYLCKNINRTVPHDELLDYLYENEKNKSTLRTLISRLNKTLKYNLINNNSKLGYKIVSVTEEKL
ncbi:response regulator [Sulfurimonas sp.]|uniref:response regulator n=1 Tax=Sulfurimonas sp. TaxID=2022749 RepID=UPI003D0E98DB